jgi:hypothetical protein
MTKIIREKKDKEEREPFVAEKNIQHQSTVALQPVA